MQSDRRPKDTGRALRCIARHWAWGAIVSRGCGVPVSEVIAPGHHLFARDVTSGAMDQTFITRRTNRSLTLSYYQLPPCG